MKNKTVNEYIEELKSMYKLAIPVVSPVVSNNGLGSLIVVVSGGNGFNPLINAVVTVYDNETGEIIERVNTDENGKTRLISLPTVSKRESLAPNGNGLRVFTVYDIEASSEDYITARRENVPIFDEEVSIQQFNLVWKYASDSQNPTTANEGNPYNL